MGHSPVPWAIEGGAALIPGSILRQLSYALTGGREGVVGALDCRVQALATPGGQVRVSTGLYAINSRSVGATNEQYAGYVVSEDVVSVAPTTSSGARSDLVIIRVENPYAPGETWDEPTDPTVGPYVFTKILQGVPSTTATLAALGRTDTAIVLARLDIPVSTATITQGMIKDLRSIAGQAQRITEDTTATDWYTDSKYCPSGSAVPPSDTTTTYIDWPSEASWTVPIPSWATGVDIVRADVLNAQVNGNAYGDMVLSIGGTVGTPTVYDLYSPGGNAARSTIGVGGTQAIPASMRGTTQTVKLRARRLTSGGNTGTLIATSGCYTTLALNFKRTPSYT